MYTYTQNQETSQEHKKPLFSQSITLCYLLGLKDATPPDIRLLQRAASHDPDGLEDADALPDRYGKVGGKQDNDVLQLSQVPGPQRSDQVVQVGQRFAWVFGW